MSEAMQFTSQRITFPLSGGETATEMAAVSGPFAIHQTRYKDWSLAEDAWTLTHLPSGYCITQEATSEQAARTLMATLLPLTDWTVVNPVPAIKSDPEKLAALRAAKQLAVNSTCWITRDDAEPQYDEPCSHAVCLEDIRLHKLGYDHWEDHWACPSGGCYLDRSRATCTLEPGHDGAHEWEEVGAPTLGEWVSLPTPRAEVTA